MAADSNRLAVHSGLAGASGMQRDLSDNLPLLIQPFRLFFLGAALFASVGMFMWSLFLHLGLLPAGTLPALYWHGHEMLFGFAGALMSGFMLTAVGNWTGRNVTRPLTLALLAVVWLLARLAFLYPGGISYAVPATLDVLFFPLLALYVGLPIIATRNWRNLFLIPLLLTFAFLDLLFHLAVRGLIGIPPTRILIWVIDLLTLLMLVMGGRVIPFFTTRRFPQVQVRRWRWLDWGVNAGAALLLLVDVLWPTSSVLAILSLAVALLALVRLVAWQPYCGLVEPMLWVLYLGYLWLAVGLALRGVAMLSGSLTEITALHAITAGALGSLGIGMMTRVALGHTGRPLKAGYVMPMAFLMVNGAALLRIVAPGLLSAAALLWALAFAIYFVRFLPVCLGPLRIASTG